MKSSEDIFGKRFSAFSTKLKRDGSHRFSKVYKIGQKAGEM